MKLSTCGRLTIKKEILKLYGLKPDYLLKIRLISAHSNDGKNSKFVASLIKK